MQDKVVRAILRTLVYSDIFDYPLKKDEIWKYLIGQKIENIYVGTLDDSLKKSLKQNRAIFKKNFYCLLNRDKIIGTRVNRQKVSRGKLVIAKKIARKLSIIPTVQLIGISGALSLKNSDKYDDIDFFVIASKGSLWLTRLAMIILLLICGKYRTRNQSEVSDKICLNMIIDDSLLSFPKSRRDLYTAHEIAQLLPVFERNNMYKKFVDANEWIEKYLPNAIKRIKNKQRSPFFMTHNSLFIFEQFAKLVQLWSIKKHRTNETISENLLAFHPLDYKNKVLNEYKRRLKQYDPPSLKLRKGHAAKLVKRNGLKNSENSSLKFVINKEGSKVA
ncbi:MAG: hypothetical protein ACD_50C00333G0011 [uncultured bacterium]|nr:MAG: hypothetical protein ACD_50C00333G0011 [uncultured bacterium]OGH13808.1 MAG: hypothetical protein A2687_03410 [Candidatus Levybacteria bacterium RIFCSPHIGHO2_01_FULL_38_26]